MAIRSAIAQGSSANRALYLQYTNPAGYPPLEHSSRILADAGWQVLFLGTGALGSGELRLPRHPRITLRQLEFCKGGWRQKVHYLRFALWCMRLILTWSPTWVYASDLMAAPVALMASVLLKARVVYHEHDSPGTDRSGLFTVCLQWARRRLAARAELCVLPNERRAALFSSSLSRPAGVLTVWNCPDRAEVSQPRRTSAVQSLDVLYHGTIVPERLPLSVLEALALLPESVKLTVIGYETVGHAGYAQTLAHTAARLRIRERVRFCAAIPLRADLLDVAQQCDVGLSFMPKDAVDVNLRWMVGASNKPFDYLARGLAVLVSDIPEWRTTFVEPGYGLACEPENAAELANALRFFLNHPEETRLMGERGRQRVEDEWNYQKQFAPVFDRLAEST